MLTVINLPNAIRPAQRNFRTSRPGALLAFGAALLLPLAGVLAQTSLPDELLSKQEISDADRQTIKTFVDANKSGLSGASAEVKKSRDVLVAPLEKTGGVSVPFRVAYATALTEIANIKKLAADPNDLIAANALRIAGQAATGNTLPIILDGLKDPRPQVRYAATVAARAAFTSAKTNPALSGDELKRALTALGSIAATDTAKEPIDGALQAMIAARDIPLNRSPAVEQLTDAAGKRALVVAKSDQTDGLVPLLRVAAAVRQDMTDAGTISANARQGAATFAGQLLVAIGGQWKEGAEPTDVMTQGAKAAEAILALVDEAAHGGNKFTIGSAVAPGTRDRFNRELESLVGAKGTLLAPPYSIPPASFKP